MKKSGIRKYLILLFMCVLMMVPATTTEAAPKLSKTEVTIQVGEKVRLKVKNTTKPITWSTSDKSIATVNQNGVVKGKSTGDVTITAKVGKKKLECEVTVISGSSSRSSATAAAAAAASKPKKKNKNTSANNGVSGNSGSGTYYWTPSGKSYHSRRSCPTLSRSRTVYSGPLSSCPKSDPCNVCCR